MEKPPRQHNVAQGPIIVNRRILVVMYFSIKVSFWMELNKAPIIIVNSYSYSPRATKRQIICERKCPAFKFVPEYSIGAICCPILAKMLQ